MSNHITDLEAALARSPDMRVQIDIRVNTELESLKAIKKRIRGEYKKTLSMKVITHGLPTQGQPVLIGDGKIVVVRIEQSGTDHLDYLKGKQS